MSSDVLEDITSFAKNSQNALEASPDVLYDSVRCPICMVLMLQPYTAQCGHSFCSGCLKSWCSQLQHQSSVTCPTCRTELTREPVLCLALRELSLAIVASYAVAHPNANISSEMLELKLPSPLFLKPTRQTIYDSDDGVYRCSECLHEIDEDGSCACPEPLPFQRGLGGNEEEEEEPAITDFSRAEWCMEGVFDYYEHHPWNPIEEVKETYEDIMRMLMQFLLDLRSANEHFMEYETDLELVNAPLEFSYKNEPKDSYAEEIREVFRRWRWKNWLYRWNRMIRFCRDNYYLIVNPFPFSSDQNFKQTFQSFFTQWAAHGGPTAFLERDLASRSPNDPVRYRYMEWCVLMHGSLTESCRSLIFSSARRRPQPVPSRQPPVLIDDEAEVSENEEENDNLENEEEEEEEENGELSESDSMNDFVVSDESEKEEEDGSELGSSSMEVIESDDDWLSSSNRKRRRMEKSNGLSSKAKRRSGLMSDDNDSDSNDSFVVSDGSDKEDDGSELGSSSMEIVESDEDINLPKKKNKNKKKSSKQESTNFRLRRRTGLISDDDDEDDDDSL